MLSKNKSEILKKINLIMGVKDVVKRAGIDATIRTKERVETLLIRAIKEEIPKMPIGKIKEKKSDWFTAQKVISPSEGIYAIKMNLKQTATKVIDTLSQRVLENLIKTRGVKFGRTKKLKIRRKSKAYQGRASPYIKLNIKNPYKITRDNAFLIQNKGKVHLMKRLGSHWKSLYTSSTLEIASNTGTQKIFFHDSNEFFYKRFIGRIEYFLSKLVR